MARLQKSITMSPAVYAELSVYADACGESISRILEIAAVRLLREKGRRVEAPWTEDDEPTLAPLVPAAAQPRATAAHLPARSRR